MNSHQPQTSGLGQRRVKAAVLSLSLLTIVAGAAVAPALGAIAQAFPDAPSTAIQMIASLPSLAIVISSLVTGRLAAQISNRLLAIFGLVLTTVAGCAGGLAHSITGLLVWRALFGLGVGILIPLSTGLIAALWQGQERTRLMGYSIATANLGGILTQWVASMLTILGWRFAFLTYAIGLPILGLVLIAAPEPPREPPQRTERTRLPISTYILAFFQGLLNIAFFIVPTNTALLLQEWGLSDSRTVGLVIIMASVGALASGATFAQLSLRLRHYLSPAAAGSFFVGFALVSLTSSLLGAMLGMLAIGIGLGSLSAWIITKTTEVVPTESSTRALSITTSALFLGQFLSPVVLGTSGRLLGATSNRCLFQMVMGASGIGLLVLLAGAALLREKMAIGVERVE